MLKVAFLGLGAMGAPMARRILKAGFPLAVWNRTPERAQPLLAQGAWVAPTPFAAADQSDVVCTMLSDPAAVDAVASGQEGLVMGLSQGKIWLDFSTVYPGDSQRYFMYARRKKADFCDVPVAGSVGPAADGTLTILAGGAATTLERARPVLEAVSKKVEHFGEAGQGAAMKLANNLMFANALVSLGEALVLAKRFGIDPERAAAWLLHIPAAAPYLKVKMDFLKAGAEPPTFMLALMEKDLRLALDGVRDLRVTGAAREVFQAAKEAGYGEKDVSHVLTSLLKGPTPTKS